MLFALHVQIVEVKGPGDRLSTKQILWLDYLTRLGVDAEVCYVKGLLAVTLLRTSSCCSFSEDADSVTRNISP